jgi:hypothetical protein
MEAFSARARRKRSCALRSFGGGGFGRERGLLNFVARLKEWAEDRFGVCGESGIVDLVECGVGEV